MESGARLDSSKDCPVGFLLGCQKNKKQLLVKKKIHIFGLWEISKVTSNGSDDAMSLDSKYSAGI